MPSYTSFTLLLVAAQGLSGAVARPGASIFARQDVCSANNLESCGSELPDNFCCPGSHVCIALAGNTSAICCPPERDCQRIQPIPCDTSLQNVEENPAVPIKTTVFDVELEPCGQSSMCCPFGYSCGVNGRCEINEDQSQPPSNDEDEPSTTTAADAATSTDGSSTATAEPSASATTSGSAATTRTESASASATSASSESAVPVTEENEDRDANTEMIIAGILGGTLGILVICLIVVFGMRFRNRRKANSTQKVVWGDDNDSQGSFGNVISDPIAQDNSFRTDFIRKESERSSSDEPLTPAIVVERSSVTTNNPFDRPSRELHQASGANRSSIVSDDLEPLPDRTSYARLAPIRKMKNSNRNNNRRSSQIDPLDVPRQSGGESISIFADPSTVSNVPDNSNRFSRNTTFTDLMDRADLGDVHRGERAFVPGATPRI
ncbi:hypothetical protein S7711_02259 [Stachybotrys chartarum IBT 7711]|uniref:Mid2 domain-containing protein n=1 Tax=Stachybotrys chartarum (strain CBS 109288 / IBT 7711) TaxID=1280523 RepID=A0A084AZC8_STACB|nr:hypothetical protein S7711_02259 [Stachybotrys chartarum IBT 7711]KFA53068.1 hypothetical protein S40293_05305 [Stachybotrys chartarum IBT 40293]KFA78402.1 hypothetical protein S40288_04951 [Stachybotrys chartarum IBT 40288]